MDRNNVRPISVSINAKFLNCLQPEWSKYVTMSHASPSYSNSPQPYYVTHPSLVVDYKEDYQGELHGDSSEDKLTTAMMNQAVIHDGRVDIQTKNGGYGGNGNRNIGRQNRNQAFNAGNGHYAHDCQKPRVRDAKYFREQIDETLEELTTAVIMMAQIQPADGNAVTESTYDAKVVSEKLSSHDRIVYKMGQSIQTIYMLGKTPNKVYDPFLKVGLGYQNLERLKKAIAAQPKMYHGEILYNTKLKFDSPDSEETLEDAEESRLKMTKNWFN
ncbi:hypothetical protein Tco_0785613 [Tanacetum coccineum]